MTASASAAPALRSRRLLIAIGMVGSPLGIAAGNLILPTTGGSPAAQLATIHARHTAYLAGSVIDAIGFALLGAIGVGVATLLPRRGSTVATVAAILTLLGGIVMGAAILVTAFVLLALPASQAATVGTLQTDPGLGSLFNGALIASVGGLLAVIALLIGRPVPVWVPILLLVGLVLGFLGGGGPLGAALTIPTLVAVALLAGALIRTPETATVRTMGAPIAA